MRHEFSIDLTPAQADLLDGLRHPDGDSVGHVEAMSHNDGAVTGFRLVLTARPTRVISAVLWRGQLTGKRALARRVVEVIKLAGECGPSGGKVA
jgi:hypothetical protein